MRSAVRGAQRGAQTKGQGLGVLDGKDEDMGVLLGVPPKSSTFIGFSIINHPTIGVPPFQKNPCDVEFNLHFSFDVKHNFDTKPPARCARTGEFR
jgi:hypothetical protein